MRFVHMTPQYDANGFAAQFFTGEFNPANAAVLYRPVCAPGAVAPCTGNNQRAMNPVNGQVLGPGSNTAVGSLVPGAGNRENGLVPSGTGINPKENYEWAGFLYAPRFGAAYDISGNQRLVLRGGGGLYYDRTDGNQIFGMSVNPHSVQTITVNNSQLSELSNNPLLLESPSGLTVFEFQSKIPTSSQWNAGFQMALPWSSTIDVEYVGNYNFNQLLSVNINSVPLGSAYLPQNQDPTKVFNPATLGSAAYDTNFMRLYQGYGGITKRTNFGNNTFHSLQTSLNRRFRNGLQFTLNYTLSRDVGLNGGTYYQLNGEGEVELLPENETANYGITGRDRTHTVKGNFVWDLPDLRDGEHGDAGRGPGHQRLAAVGRLHGRVGRTVHGRLQLPGHQQPDHDRLARLRRADPGGGRSRQGLHERLRRAVQHVGLPGPAHREQRPRVGDELHARVPGPRLGLRDRAQHPHGRTPQRSAPCGHVQRVQFGGHQRSQHERAVHEPAGQHDDHQPAVQRRWHARSPSGCVRPAPASASRPAHARCAAFRDRFASRSSRHTAGARHAWPLRSSYNGTRVFGTTLGHNETWNDANFQDLLSRGFKWVLKR